VHVRARIHSSRDALFTEYRKRHVTS
jgi:hypothetical protein